MIFFVWGSGVMALIVRGEKMLREQIGVYVYIKKILYYSWKTIKMLWVGHHLALLFLYISRFKANLFSFWVKIANKLLVLEYYLIISQYFSKQITYFILEKKIKNNNILVWKIKVTCMNYAYSHSICCHNFLYFFPKLQLYLC